MCVCVFVYLYVCYLLVLWGVSCSPLSSPKFNSQYNIGQFCSRGLFVFFFISISFGFVLLHFLRLLPPSNLNAFALYLQRAVALQGSRFSGKHL